MEIKPIFEYGNSPMNVVILASGSGTNFDYILKKQLEYKNLKTKNYGSVNLVFSNNPGANILKKANEMGINTISFSSKKYFGNINRDTGDNRYREDYDKEVVKLIDAYPEPDLIVLAGYRRRLSQYFIDRYKNKIINLYPGDITKKYLLRGTDACVQALLNNEKIIRCTVYLQYDADQRFGKAIAQSKEISLDGFSTEQKDKMNEKIRKEGEWILFPFVIHDLIANGRVSVDIEHNIYVDGIKMNNKGFQL